MSYKQPSDLEIKFNQRLDELYEVVSNEKHLPYGKPMNLKPLESSTAFVKQNKAFDVEPESLVSLEPIVRMYGHIKKDLSNLAEDINKFKGYEDTKSEFVKMRENVSKQYRHLARFEVDNQINKVRLQIKSVKADIDRLYNKIGKRMDRITVVSDKLATIRKGLVSKYNKLNS
jgi:chromosome segregation ATPase